jgi:hypothetical protein
MAISEEALTEGLSGKNHGPFGQKGIFSDPNGPWRYGPSLAGPSPRRSALRDWQQAR